MINFRPRYHIQQHNDSCQAPHKILRRNLITSARPYLIRAEMQLHHRRFLTGLSVSAHFAFLPQKHSFIDTQYVLSISKQKSFILSLLLLD